MHAILRPLEEVTAAVAMALGETSIWEISYGAAQGGGWRIGKIPLGKEEYGRRRNQKSTCRPRHREVPRKMIEDESPPAPCSPS